MIGKPRRIDYRDAALIIGPAFLVLAVFVLYPAVNLFLMSIREYHYVQGVYTHRPIGWFNYRWAFSDPLFRKSLLTSFFFPLTITPLQTALALFVAVLLSRSRRLVSFFRTLYFIPVVMSFVVVAMFWKIMLNTNFGVVNSVLSLLALPRIPFLTNPRWARISIVIVSIWKSWGWYMVLFMTALHAVPVSLYESAGIDGANAPQQFRYITMPMIRRTFLFVILISTMNTIKLFTPIMVMTDGGPADGTRVIVHYIWSTAFRMGNMGLASAMAVMLFLIMLVISLVQYLGLDRDR